MSTDHQFSTVIAVSLKAYFGHAATRQWLAALPHPADDVELVVLPGFTSLADARNILGRTAIRWGAQDCFWEAAGPWTGEITPDLLRELGCAYVEVGHAERRRLFAENDATIARKACAAVTHGLSPIICFGEPEPAGLPDVLNRCLTQLDPMLDALSCSATNPVLAYEPVWAIGANRPAPVEHVRDVLHAVRSHLHTTGQHARVIYGGAAGPGLLAQIPEADGLFLGRFGHNTTRLAQTLAEAHTVVSARATKKRGH